MMTLRFPFVQPNRAARSRLIGLPGNVWAAAGDVTWFDFGSFIGPPTWVIRDLSLLSSSQKK
jgi:hypothetical protein